MTDVTIRENSGRGLRLAVAFGLGLTLLSACESSEQKAEKHYRSGLELAEKGDVDRALVELRNVFRLNGTHEAARETYARLVREKGNPREAYGQYLLLVEQHPDNVTGRKALAEMALEAGNWTEVERHGTAALALLPDDPEIQAIGVTLDYRRGLQARDEAVRNQAVAKARALLEAHPEQINARRILLDDLVRQSDWEGVLASVDEGLKYDPEAKDLARMRVGALFQLGRMEELERQLLAMIDADPQDEELQRSLLGLYMNSGRQQAAEDFLRSRIDPASLDTKARQKLIAFIAQTRGAPAARQEVDAIIATNPPKAGYYRMIRAGMDFDAGQHNAAIAEMRQIIDSGPEPEVLSQVRVTLARMLATTGNDVGARALVEEVLAADRNNVEALKLKANWLIDDDKTGDALVALRAALEYAPRDPQVMTLMARAHERDGSRDLTGDMLSQAVIASNRAPGESLRYAAFLEQDGKHLPAEDTLVNALRLQPRNVDLLAALGRVYVAMKDWPRAEHVVSTLTDIGTDQARNMANEITARRLAALDSDQELVTFLRNLSAEGQGGPGVDVALIRSNILRGDTEAALAQADALLAKTPSDPNIRFLHASVLLSAGKLAEGETEIRALLADNPGFESGWTALYNLLSRKDPAAAEAALAEGLAAVPQGSMLSWIKAGLLERKGDADGAIAIYEAMYERDSNALVVANNLASLLSSHRTDAESLDRAWTVARRLRGTKVPAFQDTYGWIAYHRGNYEEALSYLEPAAAGLPGDPAVRYHLAMTYAALGRGGDALPLLRDLVAGADAAHPPAWLASAQAEMDKLAPAAGQTGGQPAATGN